MKFQTTKNKLQGQAGAKCNEHNTWCDYRNELSYFKSEFSVYVTKRSMLLFFYFLEK